MAERLRNNAMYAIPETMRTEHLPLHHRRRQARAAVAEWRPPVPPHHVQEAHRHLHGRSPPRFGEVYGSLRKCARGIRAARGVSAKLDAMNVVLGVGGGIAAYKSAELARALMERGLRVQVVLTGAAQQFITPLTFAALTGRKVITGLFRLGQLRRNALQRRSSTSRWPRITMCWWSRPPPPICWRAWPTGMPTIF